ncbi:MAG: hypothetical protein MJ204_03200 [Bacteroidales bacterium]|nr:hypothetical protein [Bacteroidales bacterium]
MAEIKFFNVEHGDCVSISGICNTKGDDIVVVRDFGSKDGYTNNKINSCVGSISRHFPHFPHFLKHEAILTHPHKDHMSGFKAMHTNGMCNFFDKAYIPWLDFSTDDSKHSKMLKVGLYFIVYNDKTILTKVREWIGMAPIMYDLSKQLIGVGTHYKFGWSVDSEVLWPPFPTDSLNVEDDINVLNELIDEFERNGENVLIRVTQVYEEIRKILERITSGEPHEITENTNTMIILNQLLDDLPKDVGQKTFSANLLQNKSLYANMIDDHSIVFSISNNDERALFLSDLNEKPMEYMVDNFFNFNHVKLLKSAHHGTRLSVNLQQLVKADNVVHSCGLGQSNLKFLHPGYVQMCSNNTIDCTSWNTKSPNWSNKPVSPYEVKGTLDFTL